MKSSPQVRYFTEHPASVGETYFEHLKAAGGFGIAMIASGVACLIHGLLPPLFARTGSKTVTRLYDRMIANRSKLACSSRPDVAD